MMNVVMVSGYLHACDPIPLQRGGTLAKITLKYEEKIKDEVREHLLEMSAFGHPASELLKIPLGSKIMVRGQLESRAWTKDGVTRYFLQAVVSMLEVLKEGATAATPPPPPPPAPKPETKPAGRGVHDMSQEEFDEQVPF